MEFIVDPSNTSVEISFDLDWMSERAKKLKPRFYKSDKLYFCLFGPDDEVGICGMGETPQQAALAWDKDLEERICKLIDSGQATHEAIKHLGH